MAGTVSLTSDAIFPMGQARHSSDAHAMPANSSYAARKSEPYLAPKAMLKLLKLFPSNG
jgi:hypothetical protein